MVDITISVPDKDYRFFMELVRRFDFVTVKQQHTNEIIKSVTAIEDEQLTGTAVREMSPVMAGSPLTASAFEEWIAEAEKMETITLQQAQQKWALKKKELEKSIL